MAILPATAFAATTYSNPTPAPNSQIFISNPAISVKATDPAGINSSSRQMKLDGATVASRWTAASGGGTVSYQAPVLGAGTHTVWVSVLSYSGIRTNYTWTFTITLKPTIGPLSPADGSTITNGSSPISAGITAIGGTPAASSMTLDGHAVPTTWDGTSKTLTHTPLHPLTNDTPHTVSVAVTDTAGQTASVTWTFKVEPYAEMNDTGGCTDCHTGYPGNHPMTGCLGCHGPGSPVGEGWNTPTASEHSSSLIATTDCTYCHSTVYSPPVPIHTGTSAQHVTTEDMSGCPCHVRTLTTEHARYLSSTGEAITCATCHDSPDTRVTNAIATGGSTCSSCHDRPAGHPYGEVDHAADVGMSTDGSGKVCSECHDMDVMTEHSRPSASSATAGCANCHSWPRDSFAAWDQSCSQGACHAPATPSAVHTGMAAKHTPTPPPSCMQAGCHAGTDLAALHSSATTTVAGVTKTSCSICHSSDGPTPTSDCATCHPDRVAAHGYDPERHAGSPAAATVTVSGRTYGPLSCSDCHSTELGVEHAKSTSSGNDRSCGECHPSPRASLGTWNKSCASGDCHTATSVAPLHANIDIKHVPLPANAPCVTCHAGDLASLHASATADTPSGLRTSCAVCHAAGVPASADCGTCHVGGTPDYHGDVSARHVASDATSTVDCGSDGCHGGLDAVGLHGGGCNVCHANPAKGNLAAGKASLACAGCHATSGVDYHLGMSVHIAPASYYESCGKCHHGWGSNPLRGPDLTRHAEGCKTCHNGTIETTGKSAGCDSCHTTEGSGTAPAGFHRNTTVIHSPVDAGSLDCARCHETTNVRVLHADVGCSTCHITYGCTECHSIHNGAPGTPLLSGLSCSSNCHKTSGTDYHRSFDATHTFSAMDPSCQSEGCHSDNKLVDVHASSVGTGSANPQYPDTCALCHLNSDPARIPANASADCSTCHTDMHGDINLLHTSPTNSTCFGVGCHDSSKSLPTVHASYVGTASPNPQFSTTCQLCHGNPEVPVLGSYCTGTCHSYNHEYMNTKHAVTSASSACTDCHGSDITDIHGAYDDFARCAVCHSKVENWNKTGDCGNCHMAEGADYHSGLPLAHAATPTSASITILGASYGPFQCSKCHGLDLEVEHAKTSSSSSASSCAACHPAPKSSLTPGWDKTTCAQGGCHTVSSTAPMHGTIDADHSTTAGGCGLSGCHPGGTSAAAIHSAATTTVAGDTRTSCEICHAASITPTLDCLTCHTAVHPSQSARHTSSGGIDYEYATHGDSEYLACSDCHITNLLSLHVNYCAVCHADTARAAVKTAVANNQTACTACHAGQHYGEVGAHENEYNSGNYDCGGCHGNGCYCHGPSTPAADPHTTSDAISSYIGGAVVHLSATDGSSGSFGIKQTYYTVDGGTAKTGTVVSVPAPAAGTASHTITFWSTDWSGKTETQHSATFSVTRDVTPPVTTSNAQDSYGGTATITLTAIDDSRDFGTAATVYRLDGGAISTGSVVVVPRTASGTIAHTLDFRSVDQAGNWEATKTASFSISRDLVAPATAVSVPQYTRSSYNYWTFPASDTAPSSGLRGTYVTSTDPGMTVYGPYGALPNIGYSLSTPSQGTHWFTVWSVDNEGNAEVQRTATYTADWTAPTTTSDAQTSYLGPATVNLSATDALSGVANTYWRTYRSGTYSGWTSGTVATIQPPASGSVSVILYYYSTDRAGNTANMTSKTFTVYASGTYYTLTYTPGAGGTISGTSPQTVSSGGSGTAVTAVPNSGYHFVNWSDGSTANPRTDTNVTANKSVTANFASDVTYPITALAGTGGSISPAGSVAVHANTNQTFTIIPNLGYSIEQVTVDGATQGALNSYTFTNVTAAHTISATFAPLTGAQTTSLAMTDYTWLDAEYGSSGPWGTFTIYANGVQIGTKPAGTSTWNCPQTNVPSGARIDVVADVGLSSAGFVWDQNTPITYTIYLPAGSTRLEAATWTGFPALFSGEDWYDGYDDMYSYVYLPPATIGNIVYSMGQTYTLTYTAGAGGTLSGTSPQTVSSGGSGTAVTAVPNSGYHFVNWSDGSTANPRTDTNVTANKSVTANFAINADTTPPTTTSNAAASYVGTATITLTPTDNTGGSGVKATYYKLDGGAQTTGTVVNVSSVATHTLEFWSVDNANNAESPHKTATFRVNAAVGTGTINFAWDDPMDGSWAEVWVRDSAGNIVYHEASPNWSPPGWFTVTVPVSPQPYQLEAYWYDADWDNQDLTYSTALIDTPGKVVTWNY